MTNGNVLTRRDQIKRAEEVLSSAGIVKPRGGWTELSLSDAIRSHGWNLSSVEDAGAWRVTISPGGDGSNVCETISGDADRYVAILTAFSLALTDDEK